MSCTSRQAESNTKVLSAVVVDNDTVGKRCKTLFALCTAKVIIAEYTIFNSVTRIADFITISYTVIVKLEKTVLAKLTTGTTFVYVINFTSWND
jgi:hypothetical protein